MDLQPRWLKGKESMEAYITAKRTYQLPVAVVSIALTIIFI